MALPQVRKLVEMRVLPHNEGRQILQYSITGRGVVEGSIVRIVVDSDMLADDLAGADMIIFSAGKKQPIDDVTPEPSLDVTPEPIL